eukprot:1141271-Pelagomonas_calceolata.AAC.2
MARSKDLFSWVEAVNFCTPCAAGGIFDAPPPTTMGCFGFEPCVRVCVRVCATVAVALTTQLCLCVSSCGCAAVCVCSCS